VALIVAAFALCGVAAFSRPEVLLAFLAIPLAVQPTRSVWRGASGGALIPVLGQTGKLQLALGLGATIGLALGG
jgi:1,4-dihydroxy-2-naphthoate octaprenyltransferase